MISASTPAMTSSYSDSGEITDAQKGAPAARYPALVYRVILHNSMGENILVSKKL